MKKTFFLFIFLIIFAGIVTAAPLSETTGTINTGNPLQGTVGLGGTASAPTTTPTSPGGSSGSTAGGGGGGAVAAVTTIDLEEKLDFESTSGFTAESPQGTEFYFKDSKGDMHTITITIIYVDRILLTITSEPITITLAIGETKDVDINNDGVKDIAIKLVSILSGQVKLTFRKLAEKIEKPAEEIIPKEEVPTEGEPKEETQPVIEVKKKMPYNVILIVAIVLLLAAVILLLLRKRKMETIL